MAGNNPNLPMDVTKLFEIRDTSQPLRKLLSDLIIRINGLEDRVKELENGN